MKKKRTGSELKTQVEEKKLKVTVKHETSEEEEEETQVVEEYDPEEVEEEEEEETQPACSSGSPMSCNLSSVDVSDGRSHVDHKAGSDDIQDDLFDEVEELSPLPRPPRRDKAKKFVAEQEAKIKHMINMGNLFKACVEVTKENLELRRQRIEFIRQHVEFLGQQEDRIQKQKQILNNLNILKMKTNGLDDIDVEMIQELKVTARSQLRKLL